MVCVCVQEEWCVCALCEWVSVCVCVFWLCCHCFHAQCGVDVHCVCQMLVFRNFATNTTKQCERSLREKNPCRKIAHVGPSVGPCWLVDLVQMGHGHMMSWEQVLECAPMSGDAQLATDTQYRLDGHAVSACAVSWASCGELTKDACLGDRDRRMQGRQRCQGGWQTSRYMSCRRCTEQNKLHKKYEESEEHNYKSHEMEWCIL